MTKLTGRTEFGASRFFLSCFSHFPIRSLGAHLSGTESSSFPCGSLFLLLFPQWPLGLWTFLPDPGSPVLLASQPLASAASHRLPLLAELGQGGAGGAQAAGLPGAAPGDRWTRCTSLPTAEPDPARRGPCALLGIRKRREKNLPCGRGPAAGQHGWYCQGCWSTIWRLREQLLYLDL